MHEQIWEASVYYYSNTNLLINLSFVIATKNMFGGDFRQCPFFQRKRKFQFIYR